MDPRLPVWIIEHVWTHRMMDIQEVVDPSKWPDVDSQPLSVQDSWRLRVASAQVYSIVKSRDMELFERAVGFLKATHRLLPTLVAAIKHMKIMFGLKTMVIMWMLKEGRGMIETVSKIIQFFPNKLPEYQDQCSQHEMFLMRKNHVDFKTLAQTLAMDKDRLEDYIKNEMEEQYGERYAQKVEDRLLHYLRELDAVLQDDTYIDKILKKQSPPTEDEKLLLEVITSDSTTIATTLKRLLHCDVASCRPAQISQSLQLSKSDLHGSSSEALLKSAEGRTPPDIQPELLQGDEEASQDVSKNSSLFLDTVSDVRRQQQPEDSHGTNKRVEEEGECVRESAPAPQFCSKHQRWVKSILRECPDECSEELLHQANVSSSPLLFQSSSSTSSSQDLTPSGLIPCPPDRSSQQTPSSLQAAAQTTGQAKPEDKLSSRSPRSASDTSQTEVLPQPTSFRHTSLPALLSPMVQLVDVCLLGWKSHQALPNNVLLAASSSSETLKSLAHYQKTNKKIKTSSSTSAAIRHTQTSEGFSQSPEQFVKVPRNLQISVPSIADYFDVSGPPTHDASASTSRSKSLSSISVAKEIPSSSKSSQQTILQNSIQPQQQRDRSPQSKSARCSTVSTSTSSSPETSRVPTARRGQAVLPQSKQQQPYVSLTRLSAEECYLLTQGRASASHEERREEDEEDAESSFDVNALYSADSSSSDGEESPNHDPDYKPHIKKKRLLLEYENARNPL